MSCSCVLRSLKQVATNPNVNRRLWHRPIPTKLSGHSFSSDVKSWRFLPGYEDIPELRSANDNVKRIFSLDHGYEIDHRQTKLIEMQKSYTDPLEQSIATLTVTCNNLLSHCQLNRKDKANKTFYIFMLDQRKSKLKKLKQTNPERYYQLIADLGLPELKDPSSPAVKYRFRKFKRNVPLKKKREIHEFEEDRMY